MQIYADRHALHRIPELELELPETQKYLKEALSGLSCDVFSPLGSALCAFFDFGSRESVAFRADMDALPITEKTGAEYASVHPGRMHACGHDGHMAILLELARRLDGKKGLKHNVLLIFQPGEESPGGARAICDTGVLEEHRVKAVFGLHLWPGLEAGTVFSRRNELMARASEVTLDLYGRSAHIAKAAEGVDSLMAGAEFYTRAMEMERQLPEGVFRLLKFGKFHSGTARNALSAHTHLEGSLRAFQDEVFESMAGHLREIAADVEQKYGCTVNLKIADGYPAVLNPDSVYDAVRGILPVEELAEPCMTAEDFSWYQKRTGGMFFFLGLGDTPALHADTFDFDETILTKGADFFEALAENYQ